MSVKSYFFSSELYKVYVVCMSRKIVVYNTVDTIEHIYKNGGSLERIDQD